MNVLAHADDLVLLADPHNSLTKLYLLLEEIPTCYWSFKLDDSDRRVTRASRLNKQSGESTVGASSEEALTMEDSPALAESLISKAE